MPVILWTDALIFVMLFVLLLAIFRIASKDHLQSQWRKAYAHPTRKIAVLILICYSIVGLLDSLHFRQESSVRVISVLDLIMEPISQQKETTYSAPFAKQLFSKEMLRGADGKISWVNPKLQYSDHHIFGTDKIGTDVFYASVKSIRTGLIIGILTTFITLPFAMLFGAMAGYYRGWVDDLIQYLYTTLSSVPAVLLIAASVLSLDAVMLRHQEMFQSMAQRADMRLLMICCVLGVTSWTSLCRIIRGETLKLREQDFILAARAMGLTKLQIITKHILPNLMHIVLISIVLDFSGLVLAEAVLSYVGVGVDPSTYSWGNMINSARMEMGREPIIWWSLTGAFILMFILVLAANIFADGVRDAVDPRAT
jgi:ABC-type dipeptide/oligopeptide/nickel transport system permease subunit